MEKWYEEPSRRRKFKAQNHALLLKSQSLSSPFSTTRLMNSCVGRGSATSSNKLRSPWALRCIAAWTAPAGPGIRWCGDPVRLGWGKRYWDWEEVRVSGEGWGLDWKIRCGWEVVVSAVALGGESGRWRLQGRRKEARSESSMSRASQGSITFRLLFSPVNLTNFINCVGKNQIKMRCKRGNSIGLDQSLGLSLRAALGNVCYWDHSLLFFLFYCF